jgi:hypothetical protein
MLPIANLAAVQNFEVRYDKIAVEYVAMKLMQRNG